MGKSKDRNKEQNSSSQRSDKVGEDTGQIHHWKGHTLINYFIISLFLSKYNCYTMC